MTVGAGFDPSIASAGIGAVRRTAKGYELLDAIVVRTTAHQPIEERLAIIFSGLSMLLRTHMPAFLAIEDQAGVQAGLRIKGRDGREVQANSSKTIMVVGLAIGCAKAYGVPWFFRRPQTVKLAVCGHGGANADKRQVQRAIELLTGTWLQQDKADAVATAIAGCQHWAAGRAA
jgi:crossover junction endodeoxyribonuclease RuvC